MKHMIIIICAVTMSACMLSVPSVAAFNSIDIMDNETNSMQERAFNSSLAETKVDYKGVSVTGTNDEVMHKRLSEGTLTEILFVPIGRSEKQIGYSEGCECEDNGPEDFIVDGNTCLILNSVCLNVLVYENGNFVRSIDISQMGYPMFMTKYHDSLFIVDSVNDVICEYSYSCGDLISKHAFPSGATSNFMLCLTSDANSVFVMDDDYGLHDILNPEEQIKTPLSIEATGNKINWSTPYSQNQNSFSDVYVRFLNYDKEGNTFFAVYEPVWNSDIVLGETTIRKYTVEGDLIGVARIPVEDNLFTPEHSIIVTDEGRIYTFGLTDNGATISEVTLGSEYVSKINEWSARFSKLEREQGTSYKSQAVNNNREVAQNILIYTYCRICGYSPD